MMKAVADVTREKDIQTVVSLNPVMVDGTGMCGGCRATVDNKTVFVCVDGPEFDAHKVDFKTLMTRNQSYLMEEKESLVHHECKLNTAQSNVILSN
jgi:ferredoxin--NADP+ reductase